MNSFKSPEFAKRVEELLKKFHVPGEAIGLIQGDEISTKGFGHASLDPEKPMTGDSLFDIASCSKSFTAASVAMLIADDEKYPSVKWDTLVSKLLPDDFVMSQQSYTDDITIDDIVSHRTGLPRSSHPDNTKSITRNLRNLPINARIRSKDQYNNMMFTVIAYLVEETSELSFSEFLHSHIFEPLGMNSSHLQPKEAIDAGLGNRIATPHAWDKEKESFRAISALQQPEAVGAGSIFTCPSDHIKWIKAMMNQEEPITPDIYKELTRPRMIADLDEKLHPLTSYSTTGAGWVIRHYRGHQVVCHGGLDDGFSGYQFFMPELKFGGVFEGNSANGGDVGYILAQELVDEFLDVPHSERVDWVAVIEAENDDPEKDDPPDPQPLEKPLSTYTGDYWNEGYKKMTVGIKDDKLFIDASDRGMGFVISLEHISDSTKFIGHARGWQDDSSFTCPTEFEFEGERVVQMGIVLEEDYGEQIKFRKLDE